MRTAQSRIEATVIRTMDVNEAELHDPVRSEIDSWAKHIRERVNVELSLRSRSKNVGVAKIGASEAELFTTTEGRNTL